MLQNYCLKNYCLNYLQTKNSYYVPWVLLHVMFAIILIDVLWFYQFILIVLPDQLDEGGPNVLVKRLSILFEGRDDIELDLTGKFVCLLQ